MKHIDARVRYTRFIIKQSFLELLKLKSVERVTVTELCEKAQINRATFYKHYLDIPDLLEKIEEELFQQIRDAFSAKRVAIKTFLVDMLQYAYKEKESFFALGGKNGDPNLMTKIFLLSYESAYPLMVQNLPNMEENERKMFYQFLSHGAGGVLTWWVHGGMRLSPEEVAQFILDVCSITSNVIRDNDWRNHYQD